MLNAGFADGKKAAAVKINSNIGTNPNSNEIDFCFGSADHVYFEKYEVISDKTFNGETPSDHYALYLEFGFFD
jgi:endonuclease/exonuclease/phosphatase family metal-dependent hydrolase